MNAPRLRPNYLRFLLLQVVLISLWLYVAILIVPGPWDWVRRAGLALMMIGAVLFFTARIQLGNSFALRAQARELVTTGLYSKIRNPIYVFSGVMVAGFLIMVRKPYWFLVLAVLAVAQILRSRQEARVLEARFGDRYREYRKHTWFCDNRSRMIRRLRFLLFLPLCTVLLWASKTQFDSLPEPVSNNAVALLKAGRSELLFSLMGIGAKKSWDSITNSGYALDTSSGDWTPLNPVPGTGRIAAVAVGVRDRVFLFGGYVVDAQGNETTVPDVNVMELKSGRWFRGADIPVPVDDAVAGVYRERYIYLIGGWSKNDSVRNVQVYNIESDKWQQATPIPGTPVFGHAGGLVGDTMVYVDGASRNPAGDKPKYIPVDECWSGRIDRDNPLKIAWTRLPSHPGSAHYRIAAGGSEKDEKIYFSGGTDNPYNYNGIGYDGRPAEPSPETFAFDLHDSKWKMTNAGTPGPTSDHRGLLVTSDNLVILGGMEKGQIVTARVQVLSKKPVR